MKELLFAILLIPINVWFMDRIFRPFFFEWVKWCCDEDTIFGKENDDG